MTNGNNTAIQVAATRATSDCLMPALTSGQAIDRRNQMVEFVQKVMQTGVDFGSIPGTDKPTLLKPGAEKLNTLFGLTARPTIIERVEDWTGAGHGGQPFFYYFYRYSLYRGDQLIAEADGSCNSHEAKYRYRSAKMTCPSCGQQTVFKSKNAGEGFYCWRKKGGCGATFGERDPAITGQDTGRVENPDVADQVNTLQKMAQKRALVAATLLATNASEFFTQDIEDMEYIDPGPDYQRRAPVAERPPERKSDTPKASKAQVARVIELLNNTADVTDETLQKWFTKAGVEAWEDMPADAIEKCIGYLEQHAAAPADAA